MDLELEWSQHHLGYFVLTQRALGFWNYWPGLYLRSHLQLCRIVSLLLQRALLSGNDRYGYGGECVADSYADIHTYTDGYTDFHSYADGHADIHTYTDGYTDGHTYADGHANADGLTYGDGHTYAHGHTYANGNTDAVHGKMCTDAAAASNSRAASHARRSDSWQVHSHAERHTWASYCCSS